MTDMIYNPLAKENAQHNPQIIAGHDPPDYLCGIAVKVHIYADKTAQKISADGDDGSCNQQGNKRFNGFDHYSTAAISPFQCMDMGTRFQIIIIQ